MTGSTELGESFSIERVSELCIANKIQEQQETSNQSLSAPLMELQQRLEAALALLEKTQNKTVTSLKTGNVYQIKSG